MPIFVISLCQGKGSSFLNVTFILVCDHQYDDNVIQFDVEMYVSIEIGNMETYQWIRNGVSVYLACNINRLTVACLSPYTHHQPYFAVL
jgi:hypothetical protein